MKHNKLAKQFSSVLFECAKKVDALDEVRDSVILFDELIRKNIELKSFVQSKRILQDQKLQILINVLGSSVSGLVLGTASYISGMYTNKIISQIKNYYLAQYKLVKKKVSVHAVLSNKMEKEDVASMKEKLDQILSRDTDLSIEVDESMIGGIKLRIDNTYLDASIKSQINKVKLDLMKM